MKTMQYDFVDKSTWGPGDWQNEHDKEQYADPDTGLPTLIVRNERIGQWCGYVGVEEGHPMFESIDGDHHGTYLEVHGGIIFGDFCIQDPSRKEHGICHIVEPGENDRVFWLGFDCGHSYDIRPGQEALLKSMSPDLFEEQIKLREEMLKNMGWEEEYRNTAYVKDECAKLAKQLAAM